MSSQQQVPSVTLNNGMKMPLIGLGTYLTPDDVVPAAVVAGIKTGYRYIDTAFIYQNHHGVGQGINQAIKEGLVTRGELFVTTKLWLVYYRPDLVRPAVVQYLKELNLDYVDQILMHWPCPLEKHDPAQDPDWKWPMNAKGEFDALTNVKLSDTWKELEKCVDDGLVRSIGVSNFDTNEIDEILSMCRIKPVVDQIEVHPYFPQWRMLDYCNKHDIHVVAYAPLGSPANMPDDGSKKYNILEHPDIVAIAKAHNKSPAQVCIRWNIQRGITVIPKSTKPHRVVENFQVFDFELSSQEMETIKNIARSPENRHRTFDCAFRPNGERAFDHVKEIEKSYKF
ncbi:Aldose reductase, putative [Perkinsus marinus ATCC 50983]|uniref:Aldose reductase, putative n=1 Tax=Perkinsus marinus (strain ATCC 50983 / TXsc) TaxID=423536 RepID=C5KHV1_PERM5|nr:Aldose reductase, putative [Perkinsus marinus ATCC 50983]EER16163.1 Aldose reductase, putative [Perkinsus marinus ATCC 50983]|eukprot:XP_002784367.1 Aldose reductase, putative [Perkinsus marinus ATCC 50983]